MKKLIYATASLLMVASILSSCSSDNQALSQFSKRKYLKKFKSKNVKYEDRIEEREVNLTYENVVNEKLLASTSKNIIEEEEKQVEEQKSQHVKLAAKYKKQLELLDNQDKEFTEWNKYNRNFNYFEMGTREMEKQYSKKSSSESSSGANAVVLVILCLLVITAPLAVYLYEGSITANFWLDLILLLTLIGALIYGLLVCFANISIA